MVSGGVSVLYLGLPREEAFELENVQPWEPLFYAIWRLISTISTICLGKEDLLLRITLQLGMERLPQFQLAKQTGTNHVIPMHAQTCLFPELRQQHCSQTAVREVMTCKR